MSFLNFIIKVSSFLNFIIFEFYNFKKLCLISV